MFQNNIGQEKQFSMFKKKKITFECYLQIDESEKNNLPKQNNAIGHF